MSTVNVHLLIWVLNTAFERVSAKR